MTTEEEAFQTALDADRDDERGIGHRVIVAQGWKPRDRNSLYWANNALFWSGERHSLPGDVFDALDIRGRNGEFAPCWAIRHPDSDPTTRREVEDAIGPAVMKLPPERREQLLATTTTVGA